MMHTLNSPTDRRQRGIALPIMLIMLTVMMVSTIYLLRSTTTATLTTSNLAYEASLAKAADAGLNAGFTYLRLAVGDAKSALVSNQASAGYVATMPQTWTVSNPNFWTGAVKLEVDEYGNQVEYVIHRQCDQNGAYDLPGNHCQLTAPRTSSGGSRGAGETLKIDASNIDGAGQLHYVVTARASGARGGNVVTQAVVMKGP